MILYHQRHDFQLKMRLAVGFRPNPARNSQCSPDPLTGFRRWASEPKRGRGKEGKQGEEREWTPHFSKEIMTLPTAGAKNGIKKSRTASRQLRSYAPLLENSWLRHWLYIKLFRIYEIYWKWNSVDCVHVLSTGVDQVDGRLVNLFNSLGRRSVVNDGSVVGECGDRIETHAFEVVVRAASSNSSPRIR